MKNFTLSTFQFLSLFREKRLVWKNRLEGAAIDKKNPVNKKQNIVNKTELDCGEFKKTCSKLEKQLIYENEILNEIKESKLSEEANDFIEYIFKPRQTITKKETNDFIILSRL